MFAGIYHPPWDLTTNTRRHRLAEEVFASLSSSYLLSEDILDSYSQRQLSFTYNSVSHDFLFLSKNCSSKLISLLFISNFPADMRSEAITVPAGFINSSRTLQMVNDGGLIWCHQMFQKGKAVAPENGSILL